MAYIKSNNYTQTAPKEKLFLNTIPFTFPSQPITCWFSKDDIKSLHLKQISLKNRPADIETIFPGIGNAELHQNNQKWGLYQQRRRSDRAFARAESRRKRLIREEVERELQAQFHIPVKIMKISHNEIE